MTITPNGTINLCRTPLESDYKNELTFENLEKQLEYFNNQTVRSFTDYVYVKKDGTIKVDANIDEIINCNYLYYINNGFTNKYYFCFITNMTYLNENATLISFETDSFQTYQFDIEYKPSFIEREHTNDDSYHLNVIDEGIGTGEYRCEYSSDFTGLGESHIVMASTINPSNSQNTSGGLYGGIYSGLGYYLFKTVNDLTSAITRIETTTGKTDGIQSIFYLPDWLTGYETAEFDSNGIARIRQTFSKTYAGAISISLEPARIGNYEPKNKKIFNFPYCYYVLSNNSGASVTYNLEDFTSEITGDINIYGAIGVGGSIRAIPENYKSGRLGGLDSENNDYGLTLGKFPVCNWQNDTYINYLTQNALNIGLGIVSDAGEIATGITGENPANITGGVKSIASTLIDLHKRKLVSPVLEGGVNCSDVIYASDKLTFSGYFMTVKEEQAKVIDDYFTMFGYKTNRVKIPNIKGRKNFNYVKTIDINLDGQIPQGDLRILKQMFNNGVTLWHNPADMYNYNSDNSII